MGYNDRNGGYDKSNSRHSSRKEGLSFLELLKELVYPDDEDEIQAILPKVIQGGLANLISNLTSQELSLWDKEVLDPATEYAQEQIAEALQEEIESYDSFDNPIDPGDQEAIVYPESVQVDFEMMSFSFSDAEYTADVVLGGFRSSDLYTSIGKQSASVNGNGKFEYIEVDRKSTIGASHRHSMRPHTFWDENTTDYTIRIYDVKLNVIEGDIKFPTVKFP